MALQFLCAFSLFVSALSQRPPWEQIGSNIGPIIEHKRRCELLILPSTMVEINEGETVRLNCKASCVDLVSTLRWEDNTGSRVPEVQALSDSSGARFWLTFLRLDIRRVGPEHEGNYFCKALFAGTWIKQSTYLKIKPRTTPPPPTSTTTTSTTEPPTTTTTSTTSTTTATTTVTSVETESPSTEEQPPTTTTSISPEPSSSLNLSTTDSSEDITSSSSPIEEVTSEEASTADPSDANEIPDVTPSPSLATGGTTSVESSPVPSATLPISPSSDTSSTGEVLQNSSSDTSFPASSEESPSSIPSNETPLSDSPSSQSGSPAVESVAASSTGQAIVSYETPPSELPSSSHTENSSRPLHSIPEADEVRSAIDFEENIRTEIINESSRDIPTDVVNIIPDIAALHVARRKKRESNVQESKENKYAMGKMDNMNRNSSFPMNGSAIFDDGIFACTGFGPSAVATIAILGALCLILIYAFILVLCLPRVRRRKTLQISEKEAEEGNGGIEIEEKPENVPTDPNGLISHGEEAVTLVDINNAETNDEGAAAANNAQDEGANKETASVTENAEDPASPEKEQPVENPEEDHLEDKKETSTEAQDSVTPLQPPPTPPVPYHEPERTKEVVVGPVQTRSDVEDKQEENVESPPSSPAASNEELTQQQHIPVFEDPEPQEMIVKESFVNGANVELEDKAVDTVELESQDIEEPVLINQESDSVPTDRVSPVPVFDREYPDVKTSPPTNERLSNGFENCEQTEKNLAPERDEMTKSIEDLPPPPPIPAHRPPPPPPPHGADDTGLEAPDVVSSNVTAV